MSSYFTISSSINYFLAIPGLLHALESTASFTVSVAEFREGPIVVSDQYLRDGLLNDAILYRRYSQHARASVRFRYVDPSHRERNVFPFSDMGADTRTVTSQMPLNLIDGHTIDSGGSLVRFHSFACLEHVHR